MDDEEKKEKRFNAGAVGVTAAATAGLVVLGPIGLLIGAGLAIAGKKAIEDAIDKSDEKKEE